MYSRDEGYRTRIILAALDHNYHLNRKQAVNAEGELRSHRTYRKRTKQWDVIPVLEHKSYGYIRQLVEDVFLYRSQSEELIRAPALTRKRLDHPDFISPTIARQLPPATSVIVEKKKSRYQNVQSS